MKPLYPIMAVLVIASVGASPLRTLASDGEQTTPVAKPAEHPVNALAAILKDNVAARKAAGDRIADFVLNGSGGKTFLGKGTNAQVLGTAVRDWAQNQGDTGNVAMLYFVLGPGKEVPAWGRKSFASGEKHALWESRLAIGLKKYTEGDGQIQKDQEQPQLTAFLNEAVSAATTVFSDARAKNEIDLSVASNDTTAVVTPDTRNRAGSGTRLDGPTRSYGMLDLYGDVKEGGGAIVVNVAGPKDDNSRTISMKIYTKRLPSGEVVNEVGIFDITDRNDIFGQRFPITSSNQTFKLDDRTDGHKSYELKFGVADKDGNRTIHFGRPGGGSSIETSVTDLYMKRADQAAGINNIVSVGGQDFYVLPQGGSKSALMMFPKDMIDNRAGVADARVLKPSLFAFVGQQGSDGRDEIIPNPENSKGGPMLGKVGDQPYHLEFNKALGIWETKKGEGDLPPAPPKPPLDPKPGNGAGDGTGDGTGDGNTGNGNTGNGNTGDGNTNTDNMTVPQLEAYFLATKTDAHNRGCKKNPADVARLAPELRGKFSIVVCDNDVRGVWPIILATKTDKNPMSQLSFPGVRSAHFVGHYVAVKFDNQAQYLDLLKPTGKGFERVGFVDFKTRNASEFDDATIFVDALDFYMGLAADSPDRGAITAVPKRITDAIGNKPFSVSGSFAGKDLIVSVTSGGFTFDVWPKAGKPGVDTPDIPKEPYTGVTGTTNAMDGTVVSENEPMQKSFETDDHFKATVMAGHQSDEVALYEAVDPTGKDKKKRYYLIFSYKGLAPKVASAPEGEKVQKIFRQKPFEIFNTDNPLPEGVTVQGLSKDGAVVQDHTLTGFHFISKSTKSKGVWAVFQNRSISGENATNPAKNCVGPVVWWGAGMDREKAQEACEKDKL